MSLLPVFLKLDGRLCLVVGAGRVAYEKIATLRRAGLWLRVVAPRVSGEVRALAEAGELELRERAFAAEDLDGVALAVTATDVPGVNAAVYRLAGERGVLANSVDDVPNCDFFFGSVVSRGKLQIAISTAGGSPALAQRLRREVDAQLPADLGPWLDEIAGLRREALATIPPGEERRLLLHELARREACTASECPARQRVRQAAGRATTGATVEATTGAAAGHVYLVGAGPGDPDLLTVKARRLIESADAVLHDDLVPEAILELAGQAQVVNVGKRCGVKHITQEEIDALLVSFAREGQSVVRLKSGDPMLFGRAVEEMEALEGAGIPYEVVPGVSAAFAAAAAAKVALTGRKLASSVVIATGHHAPAQDAQNTDALQNATRVLYMPGRDGKQLAEELLAAGLPPEMPCVLVSKASQPEQKVLYTHVGELAQAEAVAAPSLLIAGWTVREEAGAAAQAAVWAETGA